MISSEFRAYFKHFSSWMPKNRKLKKLSDEEIVKSLRTAHWASLTQAGNELFKNVNSLRKMPVDSQFVFYELACKKLGHEEWIEKFIPFKEI